MGSQARSRQRGGGNRVGSDAAAPQREREERLQRYILPELDVLFRVALSLTRNRADAEDLMQDTLTRAIRGLGGFDGRHPRAWLLTIMRNTHATRLRRSREVSTLDLDALGAVPDERGPERIVVDEAFDGAVAAAFRALPEKFRRVVELVDIDGLSYLEAASATGVPVGTVMSRLHRARNRMKERLVEEGFAPRRAG